MIPLNKPIIEISHLSHRFSDGSQGIDDISLKIVKGEFVVVAGHNGSGKTTLFRHLNGLLTPDTGEIKVDGISVSADILRARQMVGLVFQDADSQIVGETVCEDVAFGPENLCLSPAEVHRRVTSALSAVGLEHLSDQKPHRLSGGEKRRLAIAGILAMEPQVLVLDEPFANLDHSGMLQVLSQIVDLHQAGKTIIVSTHDLDKTMEYANRLILMKNGSIIKDGLFANVIRDVECAGVKMPCNCRMEALYG
ncbi:MAG: ABC transporter ATP-binding protein [Deltaproteobacteria bacterium]|nr:ABC transporter ATP-binding protein [Deltaproteobacteria bacterium]